MWHVLFYAVYVFPYYAVNPLSQKYYSQSLNINTIRLLLAFTVIAHICLVVQWTSHPQIMLKEEGPRFVSLSSDQGAVSNNL